MRVVIWLAGALLILSTQVVPVGCGGDGEVVCGGESCECTNRNSCDLDCVDIVACQPSCTSVGDECRATCTAEDCEFRCHGADTCAGHCGDNCYTACSSADVCRVETGANSEYNCTNAVSCAADLGDGSTAICTSVGTCSAQCVGTCTVICLLTDTCSVTCLEGERTSCGDGLYTCGIDCP